MGCARCASVQSVHRPHGELACLEVRPTPKPSLRWTSAFCLPRLRFRGCSTRRAAADRALFGFLTASLIGSYAIWRWTESIPAFEPSFAAFWQRGYFAFEAISIVYTLLSIIILLRFADHSAEADAAGAELEAANAWPPVDVFICTYNEPIDVLEKSILLSRAMDYPDARVWVLDDTRREWLRDYCAEVGVNYLTRPTNEWAKAGNLNNGLRLTAGANAAPLILVLDADFAPHSNLLKRTVGLFRDPSVGVVQTPQLYFNADPIQHNLMASKAWVDDQRIFFDVFQPAKDAWGAAFCVGTSFVVRRDRLEEMGGFPHEAVCEDINLSYSLLRRGYVTRWLNERLSVGLAAEGLPEYVTQRARWCLGTVQVALLRDGPFRGAGFSFVQRLHYLHGLLNWLCKPFIVLMLLAPAVYWFLGVPAFEADYVAFLRHAAPALIAFYAYSGWVSRRRTLPVFMEVTHMVTADCDHLDFDHLPLSPVWPPVQGDGQRRRPLTHDRALEHVVGLRLALLHLARGDRLGASRPQCPDRSDADRSAQSRLGGDFRIACGYRVPGLFRAAALASRGIVRDGSRRPVGVRGRRSAMRRAPPVDRRCQFASR